MALVNVDDYNLVTAHRDGDSEAFEQIVRRYHTELNAHARRNISDVHAAEDIVQEAFLRAYRALPAFNGEYRLGAWLHRIVDNLCIDQYVRQQRDTSLSSRLQTHAEEFDVIDIDGLVAKQALEQALSRLSDEHRDALVQRFVEDKSYEEIASGSGISQDVARARVSRARSALRRLFDLPTASLIAVGGFARRIALRAPVDPTSASPRAGVIAQLAPSVPEATHGVAVVTKVLMVATVALAVAVPTTQDSGSLKAPPPVRTEQTSGRVAAGPAVTSEDEADPAAATALAVDDETSSSPETTPSTVATETPSTRDAQGTQPAVPVAPVDGSVDGSSASPTPAPEARFDGSRLELTRAGPRFIVKGNAVLVSTDGTRLPVTVDGKILLDSSDPAATTSIDGTLWLTTQDGRTLRLSISGMATRLPSDDSTSAAPPLDYSLDARYALDGADLIGLPHDGTVTGALSDAGDGTGSLALRLRGSN